MTDINCEREKDIESYLLDILNNEKYFTFAGVVDRKDYEPNEIFSRIRYMIKSDKISQIYIEHPRSMNGFQKGFQVYTSPEYSESEEVKAYLESLGMDDIEIRLCINKAKYVRSDNADKIKRTARRSATMNDIALKGEIVKAIRKKGEASVREIAEELDIDMYKARALFSSLAIGKFIRYNPASRKYTALRDKF